LCNGSNNLSLLSNLSVQTPASDVPSWRCFPCFTLYASRVLLTSVQIGYSDAGFAVNATSNVRPVARAASACPNSWPG
jgi:hypothetical protein